MSLSHATCFKQVKIQPFVNNLADVLECHYFDVKGMWNMDKTGITTVQTPNKLVSTKGVKQTGAKPSAESGPLITMAFAVNAQGNSIPLLFIFPRKKFQQFMINGGPTVCTGIADGSGWMHEGDFTLFLQHFVSHTRASPQAKVILLLDSHASHLSIQGIDFYREHRVLCCCLSLPFAPTNSNS